jgi:cytochrome c peroxidase
VSVPQTGSHVPAEDTGRAADLVAAKQHTFNSGSIYSDAPSLGQTELEGLTPSDADLGAFRTKSLRNITESAPYYHTGAKQTLAEVIEFYDRGGETTGFVGDKDPRIEPLGLSAVERTDLGAFLVTLTGAPVPAELLVDPRP